MSCSRSLVWEIRRDDAAAFGDTCLRNWPDDVRRQAPSNMERSIAEKLMKDLMALTDPLNSATEVTTQIADKEEQASFRRSIAEIMNTVYVDLMRPIIKQFPDLNPDKEDIGKQ